MYSRVAYSYRVASYSPAQGQEPSRATALPILQGRVEKGLPPQWTQRKRAVYWNSVAVVSALPAKHPVANLYDGTKW